MKNLMLKEFKLAIHPTSLLFLLLSFMVLIPSYPYYVVLFYTCLGIFFTCTFGRENKDIFYSMLLPIKKSDIVKSRILSVCIVQTAQILFIALISVLKNILISEFNEAGIEANLAFLGLGYVMYGFFNLLFFPLYYNNPDKVGKPFCISCTFIFLYILVAEASVFVIPFMKNYIDTKDPAFIGYKIIFFLVGFAIYLALNYLAYQKSKKSFDRIDL